MRPPLNRDKASSEKEGASSLYPLLTSHSKSFGDREMKLTVDERYSKRTTEGCTERYMA